MFQRSASSSAQSAIRPTHTKKLFDCLRLGGYLFLQVSNRSWRPLFKSFDQWNNLRTSNLELTESGSSGMKASRQFRIFLIASSNSLFAHRSFGQPTPASSEAGNPSRAARQDSGSTGSQITLDVVVTDKSGRPQGGLQPQDFTLLDNKSPQKILSFQAMEEPSTNAAAQVEIVLVIDPVNTSAQTVADERLRITKYLRQNGGKLAHPTSIVALSDTGLKNLGPYFRRKRSQYGNGGKRRGRPAHHAPGGRH
jgi:hypothetical protein